jgi:alanine racemase
VKNIHQQLLTRPTFVEINTKNISHNYHEIKKQLNGQQILCVVKGNAYGHGIVEMAELFEKLGANYLAVAIPEEGVELRQAGITIPILALSPIANRQIEVCIDYDITITAPSDEKIIEVNKVAERLNKIAKIHIKVDTGMGRIGVNWKRVKKYFPVMKRSSHCNFEGLFSHFALSDEDHENNSIQIERFKIVINEFIEEGFHFPLIHLANSGGIFFYPESHFNMVRAGISLYGLFENRKLPKSVNLKPAMTWKSEIMYFKFVEKGSGIGYGYRYIAKNDTRIVTIPIGHSDGYQRALGPKGKVIINDSIYPIAGGICMDQMMVDIGIDGEAYKGDEVILMGKSKGHEITLYDLGKWSNTSIYELLSQISFRVPRIYI